jgi:hypothetical protein
MLGVLWTLKINVTFGILSLICISQSISWIRKFMDFVFVPKIKFVDFIFST